MTPTFTKIASEPNGDPGPRTALNLTDHRWPSVDSDPPLRPHPMLCFEIAAGVFQPFKDRQCGSTRPQRRVLKRYRRAEHRHDAIAGKALHDAALLTYRVLHESCEALHERKSGFFPGPLREGREANHVCKQNSNLPTFRFHAISPAQPYRGHASTLMSPHRARD